MPFRSRGAGLGHLPPAHHSHPKFQKAWCTHTFWRIRFVLIQLHNVDSGRARCSVFQVQSYRALLGKDNKTQQSLLSHHQRLKQRRYVQMCMFSLCSSQSTTACVEGAKDNTGKTHLMRSFINNTLLHQSKRLARFYAVSKHVAITLRNQVTEENASVGLSSANQDLQEEK